MPRIKPHTLESVPDAARPLLEEAVALAGGRLLNLHAGMATSPIVLASYLGARKSVRDYGTLDAKTGAAILLTVSAVDREEYAQAVNTGVAMRAGWSQEEAIALRSGVTSDGKLATLLAVVRQVAASTGHVDDATWKAAQAAGWRDVQLVEAFAYIGLALYVDYFNHYVGTELDVPTAPPAGGR